MNLIENISVCKSNLFFFEIIDRHFLSLQRQFYELINYEKDIQTKS